MRLLQTLLLMLLAFSPCALFAEDGNGVVKGTVKTTDGKAAAMVSVTLKNTKKSTITDENGAFLLNNVKPGTYTLQVTLLGHGAKEETVIVSSDNTTEINVTLQLSDIQLQEVEVATGRSKFAKKESDYVARLPLKNLENPQVYNVVSKELLQEQVVTNFDDALKNTPGVTKLWSSTGRPTDGAGYFSMRGFSVQPTMINGIPGLTNGGIDPANVERIESIKGPSGTLFGSSYISFGGLLNIVTKKPYETFGGEISYTAGGFGLNRVTADVNAPLNADKTALLRVNAAYHNEGSFQDAGFKKSFFFAPSFSYKASDKLSFLVNAEFYNAESTNALMVFLNRYRPLIAKTPEQLHMDFDRSYTSNDLTHKTPTVNLYGQANYKISDKWTSQTVLSRSSRKSDGYYSYVMFLDMGPNGSPGPNDTLLSRFAYYQNSTTTTTDIQQNFIGDFNIGSLRNRVVFGLDFNDQSTVNNNSAYALFDFVNVTRNDDPRYAQLTKAAVDAKLGGQGGTKDGNSAQVYSAYISDVLNITDALSAMASLRVDRFESKGYTDFATNTTSDKYGQTAVSPKFGLVYQIVKDQVSVFGNYMNGFSNTAPGVRVLPDYTNIFKPQQANQWEGGVKLDVLNHKVALTASYYDLLVSNMTRQITVEREGTAYNVTIQDGKQKSKGVEFDLIANPLPGLNIVAGYSYNDSKALQIDAEYLNRRPVSAGPANLANAWISYAFTKGAVKGLGLGFGGNYASDNNVTNGLTTGLFTLPSYTILNASVFYNAKSYRLGVKLDNVSNKEYFSGWTTLEKQMPRRLSVNATFRF
ncbi:TonB-dependent receptor [Chitinophaga pinensis]|uniref:TonB-dependent siderophore receptor n=1 Tax=Chitinophaga pinensis (strain ATCC 43595 / DSM 2588 / LMG 13176 / NBRC 15968 / NCIMB 11800 / UQM 2034) TaxID=485918 RepID=A0A979G2N5_CHIPD|nr:TonB-dependent receptor [Chitinophaga pinensis]ACU59612.1 TonB-dependent siderophore receptor [Chitinophaga pinensis DSM 2588]